MFRHAPYKMCVTWCSTSDHWFNSFQLPVASDLAMSFFFLNVVLNKKKLQNFTLWKLTPASAWHVCASATCRAPDENCAPSPQKKFEVFFFRKLHHCRAHAFCKTSRVNSQGSPGFHKLVRVRVELFLAGTMTMSHHLWLRRPRAMSVIAKCRHVRCQSQQGIHFPHPNCKWSNSERCNSPQRVAQWPLTLSGIDTRLDSKKHTSVRCVCCFRCCFCFVAAVIAAFFLPLCCCFAAFTTVLLCCCVCCRFCCFAAAFASLLLLFAAVFAALLLLLLVFADVLLRLLLCCFCCCFCFFAAVFAAAFAAALLLCCCFCIFTSAFAAFAAVRLFFFPRMKWRKESRLKSSPLKKRTLKPRRTCQPGLV